jgi:hypothetical protein
MNNEQRVQQLERQVQCMEEVIDRIDKQREIAENRLKLVYDWIQCSGDACESSWQWQKFTKQWDALEEGEAE